MLNLNDRKRNKIKKRERNWKRKSPPGCPHGGMRRCAHLVPTCSHAQTAPTQPPIHSAWSKKQKKGRHRMQLSQLRRASRQPLPLAHVSSAERTCWPPARSCMCACAVGPTRTRRESSAVPTVACTWTPPTCPHNPVSFSPNCTSAYLAHNRTQQPHLKPPLPGARDQARLAAPPISRSSPLPFMPIHSTSVRRREREVSPIPSPSPSQLASLSCQRVTGP
jgi:hypothetical protein